MTGPKIVVFVADLHCGSKLGLLPPGCRDENGAEYTLNAYQRWMWNCWVDAHKSFVMPLIGDDQYDLVINGDAIEGVHHGTVEVVDPDPAAHSAIAVESLRAIAHNAANVWMVRGTEAHTRSSENHIGKALDCVPVPHRGSYCWSTLRVEYNGCLTSFSHHISASLRPWTEAGGLGLALNSERLENARAGRNVPSVVVRAHRHTYGHYSDGYGLIVAAPCWQGKTRFVDRVKPDAVERCGLVVLDYRNRQSGELPDVRTKTYTVEQPAAANHDAGAAADARGGGAGVGKPVRPPVRKRDQDS